MRYFFNVQDGRYIADEVGSEHADLDAARDEAVETSAALLKGIGRPDFWTGEAWSMHVTDESGGNVFTLRFSATNA